MKPMTLTTSTIRTSDTPSDREGHGQPFGPSAGGLQSRLRQPAHGLGWGRRLMLGIALTAVLGSGTGCNRYGWEIFRGVAEIATYVAVTAMVLSWHDHHYHHHGCGHQYVVYESRPVYHYNDRWEYYDDRAETWYYYPEGVPGY